jgi:adenylate cyclase
MTMTVVDTEFAIQRTLAGDVDGAVSLAGAVVARSDASGQMLYRGLATSTLVEALLQRGGPDDLAEARAAI